MAIPLEELKRQRAQIQKHLDWLDAKILEIEPKADGPAKPLEGPEPRIATARTPGEPAPDIIIEPGIEPTYPAKTHDELLRAKVGCLLFFGLGIVLFLFLLFGLPYYL